jgi:asparagine synthase (glutamine-hydrolysing)
LKNIFGVFVRNANSFVNPLDEVANKATQAEGTFFCCVKDESVAIFQKVSCADSSQQSIFAFHFVFAGRIDNRLELAKLLEIRSADLPGIADYELIRLAYCRWGEEVSSRIYGDWSFAVWHPTEKRLFVARDHHGNTALYYYVDDNVFAFSSSRLFLLDLNLAPHEFDELYLAQVLVSWQVYNGERTVHKSIRRLPPAHSLAVTPDTFTTRQYWYLEAASTLCLPRRGDYVEAFREVFDEAVRARLRTSGNGLLGTTLSGGLDSSSVSATAAAFMRESGQRLRAYTSVPLCDTSRSDGRCMGNEYPLAETTAHFAGNIDLFPVDASAVSPIEGIRRMLRIVHEPCHAAGNFFWVVELYARAAADGCQALLTGQVGNATISWTGDFASQPLWFQLQRLGWQRLLKRKLKEITPLQVRSAYHAWQQQKQGYRGSAILPEFARRIDLHGLMLQDADTLKNRTTQELRHEFINPGRIMGGALHAEMGAAMGIEVRDPTADVRVIEFTYAVPDHIFMDPETSLNRWLIREAMKGRLPDEVRLNRRFGRQAADRVQRLRASAAEVEAVLDELARGPAAGYVDVAYMRQVWHKVQTEDTTETFVLSGTVLTRGIMAGLFVNDFYS